MIQTLDFFTPICDDPFMFGQIAAANSLSDVYAMGGTPFTAMNICCFPLSQVGPEVLGQILAGGAERVAAAGAIAAGGHTVEDAEPKFGLSVTGFVADQHLTTKDGARPGDLLVLSKPLGTGVLTTAVKRGLLSEADIFPALDGMRTLNAAACQVMNQAGVRSATDVTGYGLLGHSWEMVRGQALRYAIAASRLPLYPGALEHAEQGVFPGGSRSNRTWLEELGAVQWHEEVPEALRGLATDAQTSGGLLMAWPAEKPVPPDMWTIGRVEEKGDGPSLLVLP
jgi:selenide,water dikinase